MEPGDALQTGSRRTARVGLIKLPIKFLSVTAIGTVHDHLDAGHGDAQH